MKHIKEYHEFINEKIEYYDTIINGETYTSNWAGSATSERELIKLIKNLPETLKSIKVPVETLPSSSKSKIFKGPITNSVKNKIIKHIKDMIKQHKDEGNTIIEYSVSDYGAEYYSEDHQYGDGYIQIFTKKSVRFARDMASGKYGPLD